MIEGSGSSKPKNTWIRWIRIRIRIRNTAPSELVFGAKLQVLRTVKFQNSKLFLKIQIRYYRTLKKSAEVKIMLKIVFFFLGSAGFA
jgi:hypothetical protein